MDPFHREEGMQKETRVVFGVVETQCREWLHLGNLANRQIARVVCEAPELARVVIVISGNVSRRGNTFADIALDVMVREWGSIGAQLAVQADT